MATLISSIDITLSRKFKSKTGNAELKTFNFVKGKPVENIPGEYAKALRETYPDRYFTPAEWKEQNKFLKETEEDMGNKISNGKEIEFPTLEELQNKSLGDLKSIADSMNIRYGINISPKTLATRIFEQIKQIEIKEKGSGNKIPKVPEIE